jgi:hypothetical protein
MHNIKESGSSFIMQNTLTMRPDRSFRNMQKESIKSVWDFAPHSFSACSAVIREDKIKWAE